MRRAMTTIFLLLGILSLGGVPAGEAVEYLGQFCWQVTSPGGGGLVIAAVTHMGDGHFFLNGRATGPGNVESFMGSAEVSGDSVYMTTASAGGDTSWTGAWIGRFVLNLGTMNGSGESMGISHSKTNPDPENASLEYDSPVTLTFIPCP